MSSVKQTKAAAESVKGSKKTKAPDVIKISVRNYSLYYSRKLALKRITLDIPANQVTAFIGPSGCGKSTLLRSINRMNDLIDGVTTEGEILIDGSENIMSRKIDVTALRRRVGMVFQKPNPFPKSIRENITYGMMLAGNINRKDAEPMVEQSLRRVGLWDEVKDRLDDSAMSLSGGQAQRLCIARTIAVQPDVILMDEPTSALDPASTQKIEELIVELKKNYTVVIVTHNMQQAARVSEMTAFFYIGELIEMNPASKIFTNPDKEMTENYITGRFG